MEEEFLLSEDQPRTAGFSQEDRAELEEINQCLPRIREMEANVVEGSPGCVSTPAAPADGRESLRD